MGKRRRFDTEGEDMGVVRELGNKKKFHKHDLVNLKPKTKNQEKFLRYCFEDVPMISALGQPGSGKSMLSLYTALSDVFDESTPFQKIILIRSAVQGRQQGFVPGDLSEKMEPYEMAYKGIVSELLPNYKNGYDHLKSLGYLEFHSTSMLRSCTFNDSIIIASECQNMDYEELYTIITRVGVNSKIILEGDTRQDDLKRQREKSGLIGIQNIMDAMNQDYVAKVEFTEDDIVRSGLVKAFIIASNKL